MDLEETTGRKGTTMFSSVCILFSGLVEVMSLLSIAASLWLLRASSPLSLEGGKGWRLVT